PRYGRRLEGTDLPADRRPRHEGAEGGAAGVELHARAARRLRPHRGHATRQARPRAPRRESHGARRSARSHRGDGGMNLRSWLVKLSPLLGLVLVFLFFLVAVWIKTKHNSFATQGNLQTIALQSAIVGMAALGMTIIILTGGIDLSVGSTGALPRVVA